MSSYIEWVSVEDSYPELNDEVTSVLFLWDSEVFQGWPVEEEDHCWEASAGGGLRASVTHWAYFSLPGKGRIEPELQDAKEWIAAVKKVRKDADELVEALEFYSLAGLYAEDAAGPGEDFESVIEADGGDKARQALENYRSKQDEV